MNPELRKNVAIERAAIHRALVAALGNLWDGTGSYEWDGTRQRFICLAINDTTRWIVDRQEHEMRMMAKLVVEARLVTEPGKAVTFENWLLIKKSMERGEVMVDRSTMSGEQISEIYIRVQALRKGWLEQLIEEFSK